MTAGETISRVCGPASPSFDFVFLHGLSGDPTATWTFVGSDDATTMFWPRWLCEDFPGSAVFTIGYGASVFEKWAKKELNLHECAHQVLEQMAAEGLGKRPLAFITHSLGGILAKEILRVCKECNDDDWKAIGASARLVCFMATPHAGASIASVLKFVFPKLASSHIELLSNDSGFLTSLNKSYRDRVADGSIRTVAYYEKHKTKGGVLVVIADSADPGVPKAYPLPVEADHVSICKLSTRGTFVYRSLCRHIRNTLNGCGIVGDSKASDSAFDISGYESPTTVDRRDLLAKLIDGGREHEYQRANDLQNRFAQNYYRLGLHTEAKQRNDALLADVEQRFTTHIFHGRICKDATHDEIQTAIQHHVIDPIFAKYQARDRVSESTILQAIYFLTEQCYIQWDKP